LAALISAYQTGNNPAAALTEIVALTQRRALTLIRFYQTTRYRPEDELLSDVNWKLLKSIGKFDPTKGSAFTFVSQLISNSLCTSVTTARRNARQYVELDKTTAGKLVTSSDRHARDGVDDLTHRVRCGVKTTIVDPIEQNAQRWLVSSFCETGFDARRHQCADAAVAVFQLTHSRSRELYDLTMLEVSRVLYDGLPPRSPIAPGRLVGTRAAWMARFAPLLTETEFTKFVILARNLGPFIVMLIDPESRSRRQDRNPVIGRKNLEWVLNGHPDAVPLFSDHRRAPVAGQILVTGP
jgi:hypothetical protein